MKSTDFANKARDIAENYKTAYVWGSFGHVANLANIERLLKQYFKNTKYLSAMNNIQGKGYYFDCVGLIKAILWGWHGDKSRTYGGAVYCANSVPDIDANKMINVCKGVSKDFSSIEVGEVVWQTGHIGIYIGNGLAVEATPSWKGGVQITYVSNIGAKTGYNGRIWTKHGKLPYINYGYSVRKVAEDVIRGKYGNGITRKLRLAKAGYSYEEVQKEVNKIIKEI